MVTRSTVRDGSPNEITHCPIPHTKTPVHRRGRTNFRQTPPVAPSGRHWVWHCVALGSLWPKSLTLPISRCHMDLVTKMLDREPTAAATTAVAAAGHLVYCIVLYCVVLYLYSASHGVAKQKRFQCILVTDKR